MNFIGKTTLIAAIAGTAVAFALPAGAAQSEADCKARFAKADTDRDQRLNDAESKAYTQVRSQVDVNKDGNISADEYIVACKADMFKDIKEKGS